MRLGDSETRACELSVSGTPFRRQQRPHLAMRSMASWRVAACWSVNEVSGIGGIGGKTVVVVVEEVGG